MTLRPAWVMALIVGLATGAPATAQPPRASKAPIGLQVWFVFPGDGKARADVFNVCDPIVMAIRTQRPAWVEVFEGPPGAAATGLQRLYPRLAGDELVVMPGRAAVFPPANVPVLIASPPLGARRFRVIVHAGTRPPGDGTRTFTGLSSDLATDDELQHVDLTYYTVDPAHRRCGPGPSPRKTAAIP